MPVTNLPHLSKFYHITISYAFGKMSDISERQRSASIKLAAQIDLQYFVNLPLIHFCVFKNPYVTLAFNSQD